MNKKILIIAMISSFILSGCGLYETVSEREFDSNMHSSDIAENKKFTDPQMEAEKMTDKIIYELDNSNTEGILSLFSDSTINSYKYIKDEISELIDYYKGQSVKSDCMISVEQDSSDWNKNNAKECIAVIVHAETTKEKYYINFEENIIDQEHPENIGLTRIVIATQRDYDNGDYPKTVAKEPVIIRKPDKN